MKAAACACRETRQPDAKLVKRNDRRGKSDESHRVRARRNDDGQKEDDGDRIRPRLAEQFRVDEPEQRQNNDHDRQLAKQSKAETKHAAKEK
jgi:hypothetical protein